MHEDMVVSPSQGRKPKNFSHLQHLPLAGDAAWAGTSLLQQESWEEGQGLAGQQLPTWECLNKERNLI